MWSGRPSWRRELDPEDLREIIRAYHRHVTDALAHFGGFVAKFMGDGVLAYFGYPQAHEDDAERAVRAGLAIVDAIVGAALAQPLQVRIGIATGLVVVGELDRHRCRTRAGSSRRDPEFGSAATDAG